LSTRQKAIKGGAFLLVRQGVGMVLSIVGVLLVTRTIGPRQYGLFASAMGIVTFLFMVGSWGLDVYLLRKTEDPEEKESHQVFTLLLCIASVLCIGMIALRHVVAAFLKMPEESTLLGTLAFGIPLNLLALPAIVTLDRDLNFKQVALNELFSQSSYYVVALPLAFRGFGAWAPAVGFLTQQASLLALSYRSAKFRPRLHWERSLVKKMLSYGLSYSSSIWVYQLRELVNPVVVGRFAGAEAVGYVAVAVRIATFLSFARMATWRVAMPALAKLNRDAERLRNAISEGIRLQAVSVGIPLASFALLASFLIPLGLGRHWSSAVRVFPFIALGYLSNAMFSLHASVLYMLEKNWQVTWFNAFNVVLFAGSAMLLVPRVGFVGYGWAEVVALLSYPVLYVSVDRQIGRLCYGPGALWYGVSVLMLILSTADAPVRYIAFVLPLLPLLAREERKDLMGYLFLLLSRGEAQA
jgi:O-antigen/teichoic acid export membrane protein